MKKKKFSLVGLIAICLMLVTVSNIFMYFVMPKVEKETLYNDYSATTRDDAYTDIRTGDVTNAVLEDGTLYYEISGEKKQTTYESSMGVALHSQLATETAKSSSANPVLIILLIIALVIIAIIITFFVVLDSIAKKMVGSMPHSDGASFMRNGMKKEGTIKKQQSKVRLTDVQGIDSIKTEVESAIDALKNPQAYVEIGARPKKGILLCGAPGTGKTLLAKAIAGEAGVPFYSMNGSDFIEKYVGVGASRIRELYAEAKKNAPCIVFIDEIDAIGGERGDSQNSERDQTINALLTEMDGFNGTEGILTVAATNRLDILDSALTRPGRFDLTLTVNLPDKEGRFQILKQHSKGKKLSMEVDLKAIAAKTVGFSGAALESLMNESAHIAVRNRRKYIVNEDVDEAFFKIVMKGSKMKRGDEEEVKNTTKIVAWHEAGHALATKLLTDDSVPAVTIIGSTSGAGGVTFMAPKENILRSRKYLRNKIMVDYAGRAAEEVLLGDKDLITTGASVDIKQATNLIKAYITAYGMGEEGMLDMSAFKMDNNILKEASEMAKGLYTDTLSLLKGNRSVLENIATVLIEKETIDEEVLDSVIAGTYSDKSDSSTIDAEAVASNQ